MNRLFILLFLIHFSHCSLAQSAPDYTNLDLLMDSVCWLNEKGRPNDELHVLNSILPNLNSVVSSQQKSLVFYYLANSYFELHKRDSAIKYHLIAIPLLEQNKDTIFLANSYYRLSHDQLIQGKYKKALSNIKLATQYFSLLKDTVGIIRSITWNAIIFHDTQEYLLGIEYGLKAYNLTKNTRLNNADMELRALNAIAINYDDKGDTQKAIDYHLRAIRLKHKLSDTLLIAPTYNNIGNSLMKQGNYQSATKYFIKNLNINKLQNNQYGLATVYTNLGTIAYLSHRWKEARSYLDQAEKISFIIQDAEKIQDILYQQYEFNRTSGHPSKAIEYLSSFYHVKDSLLNIEKIHALKELETKYKIKEKENELAKQSEIIAKQRLSHQNDILLISGLILLLILFLLLGYMYRNRLKKYQLLELHKRELTFKKAQLHAIIDTEEKERSRFASDLHDSFGQTISILKMNIDSAQNKSSNIVQINKLYNESKDILNGMYNELGAICFNLMPANLLQHDLIEAISEFARRINSTGKLQIEVKYFGLKYRIDPLHKLSIYRITQEWVNNILKYGSPKLVIIQLTADQNELTVTIEDDGPGFDVTLLNNSKGNGWKNINSRAKLINATVDVDSTPDIMGNILVLNVSLASSLESPDI